MAMSLINFEEEFSFHGLSLEEEPSLMVTDPIHFGSYFLYNLNVNKKIFQKLVIFSFY
jgi:hypothetical protein